ncbi:tyrosine-type recombinase/integrase [Paracoccaceae bacterium]|nr:tyrosine-type recombinase/integrase [Paracoccaceae bacterium]
MVSNQCEYLWQKRGVYYFRRKVPNDVQQHYERSQIVICLKTKSKSEAIKASRSIASKLDDFWLQMRISDMDVPASHLLVKGKPKDAFISYASSLSDALATYCSLKGADRTALFFTAAKRNVGYVLEHLGDRPIDTYSSADAASFRDWLIDRGLTTSSISRIFGTIRAVINLTIQEHGLDCRNAFANIYLPKKAEEKRKPIPKHEIIQIQKTCLALADERTLVIALISDTGMRLSEAIGLVWGDVRLDHEYPHINLVEHPWRQLKTSGSKRLVPLVGVSLEAVKVMHQQGFSTQFLFPSYTSATKCNGNSASAALNKWLKQYTEQGVIHSFRHSFRDRLREAEVDVELTDQLGGWASSSIGQSYGSGHTLKQKYNAMRRIVLNTSP